MHESVSSSLENGLGVTNLNELLEICMPEYSVCCLSSLNLPAFVKKPFTDDAYFDFDEFTASAKIGIRFLDNVLTRTEYPLEIIKKTSQDWRRVGLGFTGLGTAFTMMKMKYGSGESKYLAENIGINLRNASYLMSTELAEEKGPFPMFDYEAIMKHGFVANSYFPKSILLRIEKHGLRNIGLNTCAPTGTTSLSIGNNCSSGIEPAFSLEYTRRIRQSANTDDIKEEVVYDRAWLMYQTLDENFGKEVTVPDYFTTTTEVSIDDGMEIQAILQKYIDHSISKTLNLPPGTTLAEYQNIYIKAYNLGLKGFTTFNPEGSMKGILEYSSIKEEREEGEVEYHYAPPRPKDLECDIHEITVNKQKMFFVVGLLNGRPYEIFADLNEDNHIDCSKHKKGILQKRKKNCYDLIVDGEVIAKDLSHTFNSEYLSLARMLSMSLRHGVPLQFIITQVGKDANFGSFQKGVSRILKGYIEDGEEVKTRTPNLCPDCGSPLVYQDGCVNCSNLCGFSVCG